MNGRLCIVDRYRVDLFEELSREFRDTADVAVIFDRRIADRRRAPGSKTNDRRRNERRQYRSDMRLLGWMVTRREPEDALPLGEARPA